MSVIRLTVPSLGAPELAQLERVIASGHLVQGPAVAAFEAGLGQALGVDPAAVVAVSTGTTALQLALVALGVGPGDEVVLPDFVFPSVASAILYAGATPVVADVDPVAFVSRPEHVAAALSPRTRAVIAVHPFGVPCDALAVARAAGVPVIEDAACALGAVDQGGPCATQTGLGCISFHPRKVITTGEGGAIVARDPDVASRLRHLRQHGMRPQDGRIVFPEPGYAARMSDLHAAVGLGQLPRLPEIIAGRARAAAWYRERLAALAFVQTCPDTWHPGRVYQSLVVALSGVDRDALSRRLREDGVETTIGTYAISAQVGFAHRVRVPPAGVAGAHAAASNSLTLPLWPEMTEEAVDRVVEALARSVRAT